MAVSSNTCVSQNPVTLIVAGTLDSDGVTVTRDSLTVCQDVSRGFAASSFHVDLDQHVYLGVISKGASSIVRKVLSTVGPAFSVAVSPSLCDRCSTSDLEKLWP